MTEKELLELLLSKVETIETKVETIETKVESIETKVETIETRVESIETDVKDVKLTMENEIRVNIQRVAEGHLDLSRNLHEAMRPSNEMEMLAIKVRTLESEVRELKRRFSLQTG